MHVGLQELAPLVTSVISGNLKKFNILAECIARKNLEISLLFGPMEVIAQRNLVRRAWALAGAPRQLPVAVVAAALAAAQGGPVSDEEALELCGNLRNLELVSGYLSYEERLLMVAASSPFPRPPWRSSLGGFF